MLLPINIPVFRQPFVKRFRLDDGSTRYSGKNQEDTKYSLSRPFLLCINDTLEIFSVKIENPLAFGSWESMKEGGVYGPCRGMQGV